MCAVSMVHDYGQKMWEPTPLPLPDVVTLPYTPPRTPTVSLPTPAEIAGFKKLLEAAREFDRKTNQPECVDPEKEKWFTELQRRVAELNEHINNKP